MIRILSVIDLWKYSFSGASTKTPQLPAIYQVRKFLLLLRFDNLIFLILNCFPTFAILPCKVRIVSPHHLALSSTEIADRQKKINSRNRSFQNCMHICDLVSYQSWKRKNHFLQEPSPRDVKIMLSPGLFRR